MTTMGGMVEVEWVRWTWVVPQMVGAGFLAHVAAADGPGSLEEMRHGWGEDQLMTDVLHQPGGSRMWLLVPEETRYGWWDEEGVILHQPGGSRRHLPGAGEDTIQMVG